LTARLAPQDWAAEPDTARLLDALGVRAGEVRMVGGAVRDALLGVVAADIDLATVHEPAATTRRIEAAGWRALPTGIAHGTVTAILGDRSFEVTTLRHDVTTDGRRATVAFTGDWAADATRRDFTINALYADPLTGAVFDYHDGAHDLAVGRVRFIGDPLRRIAEDHLRILRFFRFHARFGRGRPDPAALAACAARANDLMALSRERVRDELLKLLCAPGAVATIALMIAHGILAPVLPDATRVDDLARLVAHERALGEACVPLRRLTALLPPEAARLDAVAHRLRLSTAERKRLVATAARLDAVHANVHALAYGVGVETARDLLLLAGADRAVLATLDAWERPSFPVGGGDLIAAGMAPGPEVARRLRALEAAWVASGFAIGRDELLLPRPFTGEVAAKPTEGAG